MRGVTVAVVLASAVAFWTLVPLSSLVPGFQPMTVTLSIIGAAVLVRLNRGMPTLDWKSLRPEERRRLTERIVALTREYVVVLSTVAGLLVALVCLTVLTASSTAAPMWPQRVGQALASLIGGLSSLTLIRMSYVVWRDYDIVRLQKAVLDDAGRREEEAAAEEAATLKLKNMRSTRVNGSGLPAPAESMP